MSNKYKETSEYIKRDETSSEAQITVMRDALVSPVLICLISDIVNPAQREEKLWYTQRARVLRFTYMAQSASSRAMRPTSVQGAIGSRRISYIHMPQVDIT